MNTILQVFLTLSFLNQASRNERLQRLVHRRPELLPLPAGHQLHGQPVRLLHQGLQVPQRVLQPGQHDTDQDEALLRTTPAREGAGLLAAGRRASLPADVPHPDPEEHHRRVRVDDDKLVEIGQREGLDG